MPTMEQQGRSEGDRILDILNYLSQLTDSTVPAGAGGAAGLQPANGQHDDEPVSPEVQTFLDGLDRQLDPDTIGVALGHPPDVDPSTIGVALGDPPQPETGDVEEAGSVGPRRQEPRYASVVKSFAIARVPRAAPAVPPAPRAAEPAQRAHQSFGRSGCSRQHAGLSHAADQERRL